MTVSADQCPAANSEPVDIHDRLRECLRSFLRQVVANTTCDEAVRIFPESDRST